MQFSCSASCETFFTSQEVRLERRLGFSPNKLPKLSHIFFSVRAFIQHLRSFFEICRGESNTMRFVDSLLFFVLARPQKRKAAANSYLNSAAKRMNFFLTCKEMKQINEKCQKNTFACVELFSVWRSCF